MLAVFGVATAVNSISLIFSLTICLLGDVTTRHPVPPFWGGKLPERLATREEFAVMNAFPHLTFEDPIGVLAEPRNGRLHVYTRQGLIYSFENSPDVSEKFVTLNIRTQTQGWDDCGLLGMAFHPEFGLPGSANRGYVYVYYQYTRSGAGSREQRAANVQPPVVSSNRLSRFTIPDGARSADLSSELVLIDQRDRSVWHNGGGMFFRPDDGYLYLSLGDEGGSNSAYGNDQTISKGLFSGVIRIDVDRNPTRSHPIRRQPMDGRTANYFIPNDNPFVDALGGRLEEFWCVGLREPHRMTFDSLTRSIWVGDVGQEAREEINLIERGGNYQWAYREGTVTGPKARPATIIGTEKMPVYEYPHAARGGLLKDNAIIGGYVYRGEKHAGRLGGQYVFGDNGSGRIWALEVTPKNAMEGKAPLVRANIESVVVRQIAQMPPGAGYGGLSGFGIDDRNEIYLCQMGSAGKIFRLANPLEVSTQRLPPARLSETELFADLKMLQAAPGLMPYTVNAPLWSDGAEKLRWIAVPNDGPPYSTNETIQFAASNEWNFPQGTLFVKHFSLRTDESDPTLTRSLETRVLALDADGGAYGIAYRWRDDQSDADLVVESRRAEIPVRTSAGVRTQIWSFPDSRDCMACHTPAAGYALGVNAAQLNAIVPDGAAEANQLQIWNRVGLFRPPLAENAWGELPRLFGLECATATLQEKARSYLAANCAQCHRPGGVRAAMDLRYGTPLEMQGLISARVNDALAVIVPGSPGTSALLARMNRVGESQMPPLGRNRIDVPAVDVIAHWIRSLPSSISATFPLYLYWDSTRRDQLHVNVESAGDYQIQHSTNLKDWSPALDLQDFRGDVTFRPELDREQGAGFFRVILRGGN
ncbi:MAG TPA: PQQ-dependent sugar dehydrogenase [Verrucomicrobiae bacterium]|nr:PQQ-dependent sugar dehydrogenase [Verrucomicrobiae bacterium]